MNFLIQQNLGVPLITCFFSLCSLAKNARNIWITKSCQELDSHTDEENKTANWTDIKALHNLEANQIVKFSKLTDVSVYLKPTERVSTCL